LKKTRIETVDRLKLQQIFTPANKPFGGDGPFAIRDHTNWLFGIANSKPRNQNSAGQNKEHS
jgi:hypothetical protein